MIGDIDTVLFDLDGTLYENRQVYDRYAEELAGYLPPERRAAYLADWEAAKRGEGPARVGLGYEADGDRLFRVEGNRITSYVPWDEPGGEEPEVDDTGRKPPFEVPVYGPGRFHIGDWWGLPDVLAAHHGVARSDRGAAFLATRAFMSGEGRLAEDRLLHERLQTLAGRGYRLLAMSNSPADSVIDVLDQLGVTACFSSVAASAEKPFGLERFLRETDVSRVLSVGDHYVNDIEPVLAAGGHALFIDRHETGLGADSSTCIRVATVEAAWEWLLQYLTGR